MTRVPSPITVPLLVRQRAAAMGAAGAEWLASLPATVDTLAQRWGLVVQHTFDGGTAAFVAAATDDAGTTCVLKVFMPAETGDDEFGRSVLAHQLAGGRGCATLLAHDTSTSALLLERLGPNLAVLGLDVPDILAAVCDTLVTFWRPLPDDCPLPTGAEKAAWLARYVVHNWEALGRPCDRRIIDRTLAYCDERAAAFSDSTAVLVHGDAHGWNTVDAGDGAFKFVDPEGLRSERAHDLSVPMREYNAPLLAGDTARLVRERAEWLGHRCAVDPEAVWQWGFIERVSTGLLNLRDFDNGDGTAFLEVATRCC